MSNYSTSDIRSIREEESPNTLTDFELKIFRLDRKRLLKRRRYEDEIHHDDTTSALSREYSEEVK